MNRVLCLTLLASLTGCGVSPSKARTELPVHLRPENVATAGTIAVNVTGVPTIEGVLYVELYDQATYFRYDAVLNEQVVPVTAPSMTITLQHVPAGRYIIAGSHDANDNHALDTGAFGVPTEAYGFSRDARGAFGPPDFALGAFDFDGSALSVDVRLR